MAKPDDIAYEALKNGNASKADNLTKGFDWGGYFEKGDSLYSVYADESIPQYNPNFPDVPMFDEGGGYSPEYKEKYKKAYDRDITPPELLNQNPRQAHFRNMFRKLKSEFGGTSMQPEDQRKLHKAFSPYGDFMKPRYSESDKLISPYKAAKWYHEDTADMDRKQIQSYERDVYGPGIKETKTK